MGYFGLRDDIKYWSVTCKRCRETINFAHFDPKGHLYDQMQCVVAVQCPRCDERRRYLPTEIWRHRVTQTTLASPYNFITEPIFIRFG